jgi:hypothetical protein
MAASYSDQRGGELESATGQDCTAISGIALS